MVAMYAKPIIIILSSLELRNAYHVENLVHGCSMEKPKKQLFVTNVSMRRCSLMIENEKALCPRCQMWKFDYEIDKQQHICGDCFVDVQLEELNIKSGFTPCGMFQVDEEGSYG